MTTLHVWNVEAGVSEGLFIADTSAEALRLAHEEAAEEGRDDFDNRYAEVRELSAEPVDIHDFAEIDALTVRVLKASS